jgi:hypothetical protein
MHPTTQLYFDFLQTEGYVPTVNEQNDVVFKQEGKTFVISVDEEDDQFLRVIFPNFWSVESGEDLVRALAMANAINARFKVGKIVVVNKQVWAVAEMFIDSSPELAEFVPRILHILRHTADAFGTLMKAEDFGSSISLN